MKHFIFAICIIMSIRAAGQKREAYYDYNWKPAPAVNARFYSIIEKTDSGWLRSDYFISGLKLQMTALFEDSACKIYNGNCAYFYANGNTSSTGRKVHNKNEGICLSFHSNGMMSDSATFHEGRAVGNRMMWHPNGFLSDSIAHVNDSMDVHVGWFDNGSVSFAGFLLRGKMYGKWQFYHKNGKLSAAEVYRDDKAITKEFFDESGNPQTDTSHIKESASFKGGQKGWTKYLERNLYWPTGYQFVNGTMAVVVVDMIVNEDGKVEFVEVATPFHPEFDKIALKTLRNSPNWQPATDHNRRVKGMFRQPVVFSQPD